MAWKGKHALVVGLGASGLAATRLLRARGARVTAVDAADTPALRRLREELTAAGVRVELDCHAAPAGEFDLAVLSPGVMSDSPYHRELAGRGVNLVSELELGWQESICLNIAVTGTNGKTTTTELIAHLLTHCHKRTLAAGNIGTPLCAVADQTRELDFLTLEVSSFQLEHIRFFRSAVAVFLNLTSDHLDRHGTLAAYALAKARLFENQQPFDWAIVQSEALAYLRSLNVKVPAKVITFSANNQRADLFLDRGLIISSMPEWNGVLLDTARTSLRGPHNAENIMAALAVGRVLRLPLKQMIEAVQSFRAAEHRCEFFAEINGVQFVNDSKATNPDALAKALRTVPAAKVGEPNVWLIAGGRDKGMSFHELGPELARRVKHAYLLGETRERLRAAWSLFTPCTLVESLAEAVEAAGAQAVAGDVVLLSPACASFDQFRDYVHRGSSFKEAVESWRRAGYSPRPRMGAAGRSGPSPEPQNQHQPSAGGGRGD